MSLPVYVGPTPRDASPKLDSQGVDAGTQNSKRVRESSDVDRGRPLKFPRGIDEEHSPGRSEGPTSVTDREHHDVIVVEDSLTPSCPTPNEQLADGPGHDLYGFLRQQETMDSEQNPDEVLE